MRTKSSFQVATRAFAFFALVSLAALPSLGHAQQAPHTSGREIAPVDAIAPELRASLEGREPTPWNSERLSEQRARIARAQANIPEGVESVSVPVAPGDPNVTVYYYDPNPDRANDPAFLFIHGGGYIGGSAATTARRLPEISAACDCLVATPEYRLAPETPFPGPMEDNFAALTWLHENAEALGVDTHRIAIGGGSAGGGHAAQLAIAARDRGVPVAFQILIAPMLDDRTGSTRRVPSHIGHYVWNEASNRFGWSSYLGAPAGAPEQPYGSVPARIEDLSGLPPAWIGVGSADLFFAEDLDYARRLVEAGAQVEVYVAPGGYHAFESYAAGTRMAEAFVERWHSALRRALHPETD